MTFPWKPAALSCLALAGCAAPAPVPFQLLDSQAHVYWGTFLPVPQTLSVDIGTRPYRGFYLVVRSQWQLLKPLQEGDKVRVELLNDKGVRIDQLSQAVDKRQKCRKERCTLSLNSALRAPDDAAVDELQRALEALAGELMVDVELSASE